MLNELFDEINELKEYKKKYENAQKEKQQMSDLLYEYMMNEYESKSYEDRRKQYVHDCCSCCRYDVYDCDEMPEDILKPIKSENGWIPGTKSCGHFKWA